MQTVTAASQPLSLPSLPKLSRDGSSQRSILSVKFSSVQFSRSVMSDSLWPHGLQHTRLPCPSLTTRACSNSCPSNWSCHPTIPSSVIPFSSCLQSFPALGSFQMSQFFTSGGQSIGVSASALVLPMNSQGWLLLGLTGLITLQSKGLSRVLSSTKRDAQLFQSCPTLCNSMDCSMPGFPVHH